MKIIFILLRIVSFYILFTLLFRGGVLLMQYLSGKKAYRRYPQPKRDMPDYSDITDAEFEEL